MAALTRWPFQPPGRIRNSAVFDRCRGIVTLLVLGVCALATGCTGPQPLRQTAVTAPDDAHRACLAQPDAACLQAEAFAAAENIANPVVREELMLRIAANQLLRGDLDAGLRSATRVPDLARRYGLLERVHGELSERAPGRAAELKRRMHRLNQTHLPYNRAVGDFYLTVMQIKAEGGAGPALHAARALIDGYLRRYGRDPDRITAQFAVVLFDAGHGALAHELLQQVKSLHWKSYSLSHLARGGYDGPEFEQQLTGAIAQARERGATSAVQQLILALAHRQRFAQAAELAGQIEHRYYRSQSLTDVAAVAAQHLRVDIARQLWRRALELAPAAESQRPQPRDAASPPIGFLVAEGMKQLAVEYARRGRFEAALRQAEAIAPLSPVVSDAAYARLVSEMVLHGAFMQARRSAALIAAANKREIALANLAIGLYSDGQDRQAFQLIYSLEHRPAVDHALGEIALQQARSGQWEYALALGRRIRLAFKYADFLNRLSALTSPRASKASLALATPSHMRIIRAFARTRHQSQTS